jgi:ribosome biogenesis protein ERB1
MALKRKSASDNTLHKQSSDEGESEFELGSLDEELSSNEAESNEVSVYEAESESGGASGDKDINLDNGDTTGKSEKQANGKPDSLADSGSEDDSSAESESEEITSASSASDDEEYVLDADGNPRKLLPEIEPGYDSDSSAYSELNTIGNIDVEKYYGSMPHIGYDINGRRIMRPATGAALDQLLDAIDIPKGWTGIIDKETGQLKNLTEEELEIIKRIRQSELPNDQIDLYDVLSYSAHV